MPGEAAKKRRATKAKASVPAKEAVARRAAPPGSKLKAGDRAPAFALADQTGERCTSSPRPQGRKLLVCIRRPTPGCDAIVQRRDARAGLGEAGSTSSASGPPRRSLEARKAEFDTKCTLGFPLLADEDHAVAAAFGDVGRGSPCAAASTPGASCRSAFSDRARKARLIAAHRGWRWRVGERHRAEAGCSRRSKPDSVPVSKARGAGVGAEGDQVGDGLARRDQLPRPAAGIGGPGRRTERKSATPGTLGCTSTIDLTCAADRGARMRDASAGSFAAPAIAGLARAYNAGRSVHEGEPFHARPTVVR